jgi:hypothetical protein
MERLRSFEIVQEENVIRRIPEGRVGELLSLSLVEWNMLESSGICSLLGY